MPLDREFADWVDLDYSPASCTQATVVHKSVHAPPASDRHLKKEMDIMNSKYHVILQICPKCSEKRMNLVEYKFKMRSILMLKMFIRARYKVLPRRIAYSSRNSKFYGSPQGHSFRQ